MEAVHSAFSRRFGKISSATTLRYRPPGPLQWLPNGLLLAPLACLPYLLHQSWMVLKSVGQIMLLLCSKGYSWSPSHSAAKFTLLTLSHSPVTQPLPLPVCLSSFPKPFPLAHSASTKLVSCFSTNASDEHTSSSNHRYLQFLLPQDIHLGCSLNSLGFLCKGQLRKDPSSTLFF